MRYQYQVKKILGKADPRYMERALYCTPHDIKETDHQVTGFVDTSSLGVQYRPIIDVRDRVKWLCSCRDHVARAKKETRSQYEGPCKHVLALALGYLDPDKAAL